MVRAGHGNGRFSGAAHAGGRQVAHPDAVLAVPSGSHVARASRSRPLHHTLSNCASGCSRGSMSGRAAAQPVSAYGDEPLRTRTN